MISRRSFLQRYRRRRRRRLSSLLRARPRRTRRLLRTTLSSGSIPASAPAATATASPAPPSPSAPCQLTPDTFDDGWDWCSGYHISDTSIMGFSHTHLSGTGCGDLLDFLVMPGTGPAKVVPGTRENPDTGYRSRFDHADEIMVPGYYSVPLKDYNVRAELTATERGGFHRYTFPASEQAYLVLDLQHCYGGVDNVVSAELSHPAPDTLAGGRVTSAWGPNRHAYFSLQFSKTPDRIVFYQDDKEVAARTTQTTGNNLKCVAPLHHPRQ